MTTYFQTKDMGELMNYLTTRRLRDVHTSASRVGVKMAPAMDKMIVQPSEDSKESLLFDSPEVILDFCGRMDIPANLYNWLRRIESVSGIPRNAYFAEAVLLAKHNGARRSVVLRMIQNAKPIMTVENGKNVHTGRCQLVDKEVVRGVVSDRYMDIPDSEILAACIPEEATLHSARVGREYSRYRFTMHEFKNVDSHQPIRAGFEVRNSEIGYGAFVCLPFVEVQWCGNGATIRKVYEEMEVKQKHIQRRGRELSLKDYLEEIAAKIDNICEQIGTVVNLMEKSANITIYDIDAEIKAHLAREKLSEKAHFEPIKRVWQKDPQMNAWGVAQAFTGYANGLSSPRQTDDFQELGGRIFMMTAPLVGK